MDGPISRMRLRDMPLRAHMTRRAVMARVKLVDLPEDMPVSQEEIDRVRGGMHLNPTAWRPMEIRTPIRSGGGFQPRPMDPPAAKVSPGGLPMRRD